MPQARDQACIIGLDAFGSGPYESSWAWVKPKGLMYIYRCLSPCSSLTVSAFRQRYTRSLHLSILSYGRVSIVYVISLKVLRVVKCPEDEDEIRKEKVKSERKALSLC